MTIKFTKMHGAGNDYVYVAGFDHPEWAGDDPAAEQQLSALARRVSDRHFGIGSDGLVLIMPSAVADFRMRMFNADGSEAEMCGNASRCVGKLVHDSGLTDKRVVTLETRAGIKTLELYTMSDLDGAPVVRVRVNMGRPRLRPDEIPVSAEGEQVVDAPINMWPWRMTCVSMGNPHAVYFVDDIESLDLPRIGPSLETHPRFPRRTNSEFVEVTDRRHVKMRVWERGAGETLACGTGCCATAVAGVLTGRTERNVTVDVMGGQLDIEWNESDGCVYMTGPAETVFTGEIEI